MSKDHGLEQAKAQYSSICDMVAALDVDYDRLEELKDEKAELLSAVREARTEDELKEAEDDWQAWETENDLDLAGMILAADGCESEDAARDRVQEDPLSVQVRSDWCYSGDEMVPSEFEILLCTGGPAVRIRGDLDEHRTPDRAWIEYQDWGTPWTMFFSADQDVLLRYCQEFFFG